jgi:hypothetical protein
MATRAEYHAVMEYFELAESFINLAPAFLCSENSQLIGLPPLQKEVSAGLLYSFRQNFCLGQNIAITNMPNFNSLYFSSMPPLGHLLERAFRHSYTLLRVVSEASRNLPYENDSSRGNGYGRSSRNPRRPSSVLTPSGSQTASASTSFRDVPVSTSANTPIPTEDDLKRRPKRRRIAAAVSHPNLQPTANPQHIGEGESFHIGGRESVSTPRSQMTHSRLAVSQRALRSLGDPNLEQAQFPYRSQYLGSSATRLLEPLDDMTSGEGTIQFCGPIF